MSTFKLKAPWEVVKELMKENNHELTDDDLSYTPGQEQLLLDRLQTKLNMTKEQVKDLIESISFNSGIAG